MTKYIVADMCRVAVCEQHEPSQLGRQQTLDRGALHDTGSGEGVDAFSPMTTASAR